MISSINSIILIEDAKQYTKAEILSSEGLNYTFNRATIFCYSRIIGLIEDINAQGGTLVIDQDKPRTFVIGADIELSDRIENPDFYADKPPYGEWKP